MLYRCDLKKIARTRAYYRHIHLLLLLFFFLSSFSQIYKLHNAVRSFSLCALERSVEKILSIASRMALRCLHGEMIADITLILILSTAWSVFLACVCTFSKETRTKTYNRKKNYEISLEKVND